VEEEGVEETTQALETQSELELKKETRRRR
jgi:hypothetical protein